MNAITVEGRQYPIPPGMNAEQYRAVVEWQIAQGTPPPACPEPVVSARVAVDDGPVKKQAAKGIEANLLLFRVFLDAFGARAWTDLKGRYQRDDSGAVVVSLLRNTLVDAAETHDAVAAVMAYAGVVQRGAPAFAYTDFQFFTVLFSELFLRNQQEVLERLRVAALRYRDLRLYARTPPEDGAQRESWLLGELERCGDKVRGKAGTFSKAFEKRREAFMQALALGRPVEAALAEVFDLTPLDDYLRRINRLAFYMATGAGKTHLMHINLMQAWERLTPGMGLPPGRRPPAYVIAPSGDLAAQHARELRRFFPGHSVLFVEDGQDAGVTEAVIRALQKGGDIRVLTTHQLAEVMKRLRGGFFGESNPFGEANLVFADEGHKGATSDTGWRDDRNRLIGERGFCFEYSATFTQSIKEKTPLLREYAKAILFDYPYSRFYRDGYGKKPAFFPKEDAEKIAAGLLGGKPSKTDLRELTGEDRWRLFVQQLARFAEQVEAHRAGVSLPDYVRHGFAAPLMLLMGLRVDDKDGTSNVKEVIGFLSRFLANADDESRQGFIAECGAAGRARFDVLLRHVFHAATLSTLEVRRLSGSELGLKVSGAARYFGVVYVGNVDAVGWEAEEDRLTGSLIDAFFDRGDAPDINLVVAARMLAEGWNSHRISSLGLVELGKSRGSLVVQLFGRGVRLAGVAQAKLKRGGRYEQAERFDVFGYQAAYLKTFIEEAETAEIVEEKTLEIRIELKSDEPNGRRILKPGAGFAESGRIVELARDGVFDRLCRAGAHPVGEFIRLDARPLVDVRALFESVAAGRIEPNYRIGYAAFQACCEQALAEVAIPAVARLGEADFFQRWAGNRMNTLLAAYYRRHAHDWEFEHAEVAGLSEAESRNLNFGAYRISGAAAIIDEIEKRFVLDHHIPPGAYSRRPGEDQADKARFGEDVLAVLCEPHLYSPLLVRLLGHDDIRIAPDRLEPSELRFVEKINAYAETHPGMQIALLRNQKEWGFLGFYPDFVLWLRHEGIEHVVFIDPKGLTLHNTEDVVAKLGFSLALEAVAARLGETHADLRFSSFLLLNQCIAGYLADPAQSTLLAHALARLADIVPGPEPRLAEALAALNARENSADIDGLLRAVLENRPGVRGEALRQAMLGAAAGA